MPVPRLVTGTPTSPSTPPIPLREPAGPPPPVFVSLRHWNQLPRFSGVRLIHLPVSCSVGAEDLRVPRRVGTTSQLLRKDVSLNCPPPLTRAAKQGEQYGERGFQQSGIVWTQKLGTMLPAAPFLNLISKKMGGRLAQ